MSNDIYSLLRIVECALLRVLVSLQLAHLVFQLLIFLDILRILCLGFLEQLLFFVQFYFLFLVG